MGYFSDLSIQRPQKTPGEHLNFLCLFSGCSAPVFSGRKFLETPGKEQDDRLPGTVFFLHQGREGCN